LVSGIPGFDVTPLFAYAHINWHQVLDDMSDLHSAIEQAFVEHSGRVLAALIALLGDFNLAEDAMQEAFVMALEHWAASGIPQNPGGWIYVTARRKAIDHLRRAKNLQSKLPALYQDMDIDDEDPDHVPDERLKLIFTCCHPALERDAQIALTLKTLGGLSTEDIARVFLVPVPTMAQRLVRVKRKIAAAGIPYRVPPRHLMHECLDSVLAVLYLIFNEGYAATAGHQLIRHDLCAEAIRLARVLTTLLAEQSTSSPEALGLLALMLLHYSRSAARTDPQGNLAVLEEQDRSLWNRAMIAEGLEILETAAHMRKPGMYQLQAAISAVHAQAQSYEHTDWREIAALYRELYKLNPSPVIDLNWAVAIAMSEGCEVGLALLDQLNETHDLSQFVPFYAARADLFRRTADYEQARLAYQQALALTHNTVERDFFLRRLRELDSIP